MYRLLIVDDEYAVTDGLYEFFTENTEFDFCAEKAYCGSEANELAEKMRIDILISDISMPDINGMELYKKVQKIWPHCKAVFLTGYDNFGYIQQVLRQGAVDYIIKTEGDEVLLKAVVKAVRMLEGEKIEPIYSENSGKDSNRVIAQINLFIEKNIFSDLSVANIAQALHYNPSYISRLYKQETGKNLADVICDIKIKRAKELLDNKDLKIYFIGQELGFESSSYFARFFKKHTDMLPQEYRDKEKKH